MKGGNEEESYLLLFGHEYLHSNKSVVDWKATKPIFTYGPPNNQIKVEIHFDKLHAHFLGKSIKPLVKNVEVVNSIFTDQTISYESIKYIGLGLYAFSNDGTLAKWLAKNPY